MREAGNGTVGAGPGGGSPAAHISLSSTTAAGARRSTRPTAPPARSLRDCTAGASTSPAAAAAESSRRGRARARAQLDRDSRRTRSRRPAEPPSRRHAAAQRGGPGASHGRAARDRRSRRRRRRRSRTRRRTGAAAATAPSCVACACPACGSCRRRRRRRRGLCRGLCPWGGSSRPGRPRRPCRGSCRRPGRAPSGPGLSPWWRGGRPAGCGGERVRNAGQRGVAVVWGRWTGTDGGRCRGGRGVEMTGGVEGC